MDAYSWMWLAAMVFFAAVEAATVALVSLWFLFGAVVAFIASLLGAQLWLQGALFVLASAVFLLLLRPLAKRFVQPRIQKTNFDRIVGLRATVVEAIDNLKSSGAIKVEGTVWSARSEDGKPIEEGATVEILDIQGVKAIVKQAEL